MKKKEISLAASLICTLLLFCGIIMFVFPVKYNNWGGEHMWLSGTSVKFVNMWLQEGAFTHRCNVYESFDAIEYNTLSDRTLYVSYPTGSTFFLYLAARICGLSRIDISFLKHFDVMLFCLEALLITGFVHVWLSEIGFRHEKEKFFISVATSLSWVLLPNSIYYLSNVYYADQAIILWVTLFLLVEFLSNRNGKKHHVLKGFNFLIIYTGILVDYYFWIMAFIAFVMQVLKDLFNKKKICKCIKKYLIYIIPVFLALATYYWQLSYTDGWLEMLKEKFLLRAGADEQITFRQIIDNSADAFTGGSASRMYVLVGLETVMIIMGCMVLIRTKKVKNIVINNNISIMVVGMISPLLHLLLLRNHFVEHGFGPLKFDWVYVMSFLCMTFIIITLIHKHVNDKVGKISVVFLMFIVCVMIWNGVSFHMFSLNTYVRERTIDATNDLEDVIYKVTDKNDVLFSFTTSIESNPPVSVAICEKEVHQIENISDISILFPALSPEADILFVIDKLIDTRTDEIEAKEMQILKMGQLIYEDELYQIVKLTNG